MNFGRQSTSKKRNALTSRSSMMGKRAHVSLIRVLFFSLIAVCVMGICVGVGSISGIIANAPDVDEIDITPLGYATTLYDDAGNKLRQLSSADSNRILVSIDQIPESLQNAVAAIEDERFYEHNGIDVTGILRATVNAVTTGSFSEGASTITQQLLKNNVFTEWTSETTLLERFTRKFQEQYLAVQVEKIYDKQTILENYLNTINLGAGTYGVQAASKQYFNKDVWDLTLSECAVLAGITQNPTKYNPITNPEDNATRRQEVLEHMLDQGYIAQAEYDEAISDDVYTRIQEAQNEQDDSSSTVYTYFEDELIDQVINDLMSIKGYSRTQAQNLVYSGGLQIMTTQDPDIQAILDEEYADESNFPSSTEYLLDYALTVTDAEGNTVNYSDEMMETYFQGLYGDSFDLLFSSTEEGQTYVDEYRNTIVAGGSTVVAESVTFTPQPQSSMSVIDQHTGYVKAIVGGRGEKTASLTLNRATDTTRQPGSTFKILSTYAPALNELGQSLATTYVDEEYYYPDGSEVKNASLSYSGTTTIRRVITNSINVVAVKCLETVTPELGLQYLDNFGFTTLAHGDEEDTAADGTVYTDANLSTALGGITYGVTNVELCAAYAAIANGGNYIKPIYYTQILDHDGNVLIDNTSVSRSVIKESTAYLLTSAMEDVVSSGTGMACQLDNMAVAGKTGTTESYNDLWFVGYTPYYTCAVWSGYDNNQEIPSDARNFHKNLWKKVMTRIHENLEYQDFTVPSSVEKISVCSETGLLPRAGCTVITEYFDIGSEPTEYCEEHYYDAYYEDEDEDDTDTVTVEDTTTDTSSGTGTDDSYYEDSYEDSDTSYYEDWDYDSSDSGDGWIDYYD